MSEISFIEIETLLRAYPDKDIWVKYTDGNHKVKSKVFYTKKGKVVIPRIVRYISGPKKDKWRWEKRFKEGDTFIAYVIVDKGVTPKDSQYKTEIYEELREAKRINANTYMKRIREIINSNSSSEDDEPKPPKLKRRRTRRRRPIRNSYQLRF